MFTINISHSCQLVSSENCILGHNHGKETSVRGLVVCSPDLAVFYIFES
jgi:hypothetical protein